MQAPCVCITSWTANKVLASFQTIGIEIEMAVSVSSATLTPQKLTVQTQ
jgi:hypothetical protein